MPEGGEEKGFAETAGTEQDVVFSLVFEGLYKGSFINVEVSLCDEGFEVADAVRGFHVFFKKSMGESVSFGDFSCPVPFYSGRST